MRYELSVQFAHQDEMLTAEVDGETLGAMLSAFSIAFSGEAASHDAGEKPSVLGATGIVIKELS